MIDWIKKAWYGEQQLWHVFWIAGLTIFFLEIIIGFFRAGLGLDGLAIDLLHLPVSLAMSVWWWVSVWRCAFNSHLDLWAYLARIIVALQAALATIAILGIVAAIFLVEVSPY